MYDAKDLISTTIRDGDIVPTLEERLGLVEDKMAIEQLIYKYSQGFDRKDRTMLRSVWAGDATLSLGEVLGTYEGIDQIMEGAERLWLQSPRMHHWMSNAIINVSLDKGEAETDLDCFIISAKDGPTQLGGHYSDRFERRRNEWKFVYRSMDLHYWAPLPNWSATSGSDLA